MAFMVRSNSFKDGDYLAADHILSADYGFGCAGGNKSPHLAWSGAPEGTKSFVVTCFDPDAPTPSGFWHWALVDLPADVTSLEAGAGAPGADLPGNAFMLRNDGGQPGFMGAAPPPNDQPHRYFFVVHAVGEELQSRGFGPQLLAAIFRFDGYEHPVYWIYGYKRGAFWPFVPTGKDQERDNAEELELKAKLDGELPIEQDISRWFAMFDAPL